MSAVNAEHKQQYLDALSRLGEEACPNWAGSIRARGAEAFASMDWPRRGEEAWRYTDVSAVVSERFDAEAGTSEGVEIGRWKLGDADAELVFVDGRYAAGLSRAGAKAGFKAMDLWSAIREGSQAVRDHLGAHLLPADAFAALNTAFLQDGAFVHAAKDAQAGLVHVLHVATGAKRAAHPRNLFVLERGSSCTVVETFAALDGGDFYLNNAAAEAFVGEGARLNYDKVVEESERGYHISSMQALVERSGRFDGSGVSLGGKILRNGLNVGLAGEGAESYLYGLYVADRERLVDNALFVDHAKPYCVSRIGYRGILDDAGRGVFTGRVVVERGAQKTDSNQENNNLVLSDAARIDTKPQLEIFADDVKCTHGATVGQPSAESIYYFKTRGIDELSARRMLTVGFAAEILGHLQVESVKTRLTAAMFARFSGKRAEA